MSDLLNKASLVLIPSGYKEDTVYSVVPSDGSGDLSFTRASNGTRINSAGLVEVCPWNLLEQSEDLSNAIWTKEAGNTITTNTTTAPNGTTTADTISASATNNLNTYQIITTQANAYTYSVYIKKNSTNLISTYIYQTGVGFVARGEINFDNGTFTASLGTGAIENVGDGWFRVSLSATLLSASHSFGFYTDSTTGTRNVYAWGAQTNIGSTAKPYFPTTDRLNVPRLTYQNGGGGCPSLLLEKQSTNYFTYSEQLQTGTLGTLTVTPNTAISPDGTQNADSLGTGYLIKQFGTSLTAGTYTYSLFLKYLSANTVSLYIYDGANYDAVFNVSTGVVTSSSAGVTASMQNMGNGWYRCIMTVTSANNVSEVGFNTGNVYAWGAQMEASSYVTSYISTQASSATRVADACFKTGISSLIGQTEGVLFVDVNTPNNIPSPEEILPISIFPSGGGVGGTQAYIAFLANGAVRFIYFTGSIECNITTASGFWSAGNRYKLAAVYKQNDFAFYINGSQIGTDNSGNVIAMADLYLDYQGIVQQNTVNQAALFKTRLTNAELASLTTI
jgi:hypothetical protein